MTNPQDVALYLINGIRTPPGRWRNWNGRGVTHAHNREDPNRLIRAEKIEYYSFALGRPIGQKKRADKLSKCRARYKDPKWHHIAVAHSNGADVLMDSIRDTDFCYDEVFLISPAIDRDFVDNGINDAWEAGQIKNLTLWIAEKDWALRFASLNPARWLGYGTLGRKGPQNAAFKVHERTEPKFGHSTWFNEENFEDTMDRILNPSYN